MSTVDIKEIRKYEKQKNAGIILIIVGIPTIFAFGLGIVLFFIGLYYVIHSSKQTPSRKTGDQLPVESQVAIMSLVSMERFKRKLRAGIICFGIAIALILIGIILWISIPKDVSWYKYAGELVGAFFALFFGGILFIAGVGLLVHSAVLKERLKKLEKSESKVN